MVKFGVLGVLAHWCLFSILRMGNRGEVGAAAPAAITVESLGAIQGDAFRALLPADIQAKPYAKEINTFSDLVKKFDGATALLGQRTLPDANTPLDKWGEFHSKFRPESPDKYAVGTIEGVAPEYVQKAGPIVKIVQTILHNAGASPYQANIILPGILKELFTAETKHSQFKDQSFAKLAGELFGDKKDAVIQNGKTFLMAHLPENIRPLLESFDEKQLTVVLAATDALAKKFTGEDPFRGGSGGIGGGGAETKEQLVAQMQAIMKDPAYSDPFKDKPKHKELSDKMEVTRGKLKVLQGQG